MQNINHCISKRIVEIAKKEGKAIALETCWVSASGLKEQKSSTG